MAKLLGRDQIFAAKDIQTEDVSVPEWDGIVRVKGMNGTERNDYESSLVKGRGKNATVNMQNAMAKMIAQTVIDEEGKAIFKQADVEELGRKSGKALSRVYGVAARLSGMTEEDMEELLGNSESAPNDTSTSN